MSRKNPHTSIRSEAATLEALPLHAPTANAALEGPAIVATWISVKRAAEMFGVSEATLWRWVKYRADFPRPVKFSPGCTRLNLRQLQNYVSSLERDQ